MYVTNSTQLILDIDGYFVPAGSSWSSLQFYPLAPCRIADTRHGSDFPGPFGAPSLIGGAAERSFPILSSSCHVPSSAAAYSLNFTAVPDDPDDPDEARKSLQYLTVWPTGQTRPVVSTLSAPSETVVASAAIVRAGASGAISVYVTDTTDLLIDIDGYFAPPSSSGLNLFTVTPCRVRDTRSEGPSSSGTIVANVAANSCMPQGVGARAFVLNATVVPPDPFGYLTLWPDGQSQPVVSSLNALDGAITSNVAIVPAANGSIDAYGSNPTQLILDIAGYFAP